MIFVHIGAGAGDLDPTTNFRDGFSELVKNHESNAKKVFIVEANPINIKKLKKCWKNYKSVKIFNFAIVSNKIKNEKIRFYYCKKDAPHYQLFSSDIKHVKHYFPNLKIESKLIRTVKIKDFMEKNFKKKIIDFFSVDVEGGDFDIIINLDLKKYNIQNISLEYLHLTIMQKKKLIKKLIANGYSYNGFGVDHNNIDWSFKKKTNIWNNWISKLMPYIHRKHYKRLNKIIVSIDS